jgi:hypothetical protein
MNNEMEDLWIEAFVAWFEGFPEICLEKLKKIKKYPHRG